MNEFPSTQVAIADLTDSDIEEVLRTKLVRAWANAHSPSQDHTRRLAKRLSYAWFEKISTSHEPPGSNSLGCLKEKFRITEGPADCLFAIGCLEKVIKKKGKEPNAARLYLLGFIDPRSIVIALGTTVEPEFELHGATVGDQAVIFSCSHLTWDVFTEEKAPLPEPELVLSRSDPLKWVYIYHYDPPRAEDVSKFDIEKEVMNRLKCIRNKTSMSIDSRKTWQRDRICIHALILAACTDDNIEKWFIESESAILSENLASLSDFEDRILTMKINSIEYTSVQLQVYDTFELKVVDLNRERLTKAIAAARNRLTSPQYLNRDPKEGEEEFFVLIQKIRDYVFELIDKN